MSVRGPVLLMATLLAGCTLLQPQPMPDPAQGMGEDTAPIGPVVELGGGQTERGEFRYVVWEARIGTCRKVEFADGDGPISCGGTLELGHEVMSLSSFGGGTGGWDVEGLASDEVAELWLDTENGARVAVPLISAANAGIEGQVFYMAVREENRPIRLIGLDEAGAVVAEVAIPPP